MLLLCFSLHVPLVHCMYKAFLLIWCQPLEEPELASCARHNRRAEASSDLLQHLEAERVLYIASARPPLPGPGRL